MKLYRYSITMGLGTVHKKVPLNTEIVDVIYEDNQVKLIVKEPFNRKEKIERTFTVIKAGMDVEPSWKYIGRVEDTFTKPHQNLFVFEIIHGGTNEMVPGT